MTETSCDLESLHLPWDMGADPQLTPLHDYRFVVECYGALALLRAELPYPTQLGPALDLARIYPALTCASSVTP